MTDRSEVNLRKRAEIESPCVKTCVIHSQTRLCLGCARSLDEIAQWSRMTPEARRRVMAELPSRRPAPAERGEARRPARIAQVSGRARPMGEAVLSMGPSDTKTEEMRDESDEHSGSYHYRLIARAIARIDEAGGERLGLDELAAELGLSPAHFQRVFSRWVGVSPKRYQQYLALGHARGLLAARRPVLDTALEAGLSGPGRLHDLFLRWESMTPGEVGRGGGGVDIFWGWFDSPFGPALAMGTARGLCGIGFAGEQGAEKVMADLTGRWPAARFTEDPARLEDWVRAAFGTVPGGPPVQVIGAPFQLQVWQALLAIPPGQVSSYGEIAAAIGRPKAARAVGAAVGANPLSWLIPCHRVIGGSGALTGYRWGLPVKRAMLAWESARADSAA